jgi:hypothetical protein
MAIDRVSRNTLDRANVGSSNGYYAKLQISRIRQLQPQGCEMGGPPA